MCLGYSVAINPGYGSISLEHTGSSVAATQTKSKVLDGAKREEGGKGKERERERERELLYKFDCDNWVCISHSL